MPFEIQEMVPEDLKTVVEIEFRAFHPHDTMHRLIYPSPEVPTQGVYDQALKRQLENWTTGKPPGSEIKWIKAVDTKTGKIVGASKWMIFHAAASESEEEKREGKKRWSDPGFTVGWLEPAIPLGGPEGIKGLSGMTGVDDQAYVDWIMNEVTRRRRERIQGPAVLLDFCFCDPAYQRRGIGQLLVSYGIKRADEMGVEAHVEASPLGRRLYQLCGFRLVENVLIDAGEKRDDWRGRDLIDYDYMIREVGGPKQ
ncbi:acyl-CoA N-acyltransferase [Xylogone sp. PMI_703]|nr:acyl-CoA N-acyltransferase [Xylogone sp. PMI_703]